MKRAVRAAGRRNFGRRLNTGDIVPARARTWRWTRRKIIAVVVVVAGIIGAFAQGILTRALEQFISPDEILDRASVEPAIRAIVDIQPYTDGGHMLALPGMLNATAEELRILNEYATEAAQEGRPEKYRQLITSKGGIQVGRSKMTVGLEGGRQQTVRVTDVRAVILTRDEPLIGTLLCAPSEGADTTEKMLFDLDRPAPVAQLVDENGEVNSRYFSQRTISLARNELVTLDLTFDLTATYAEWVVELDVVYGDVRETIRVDNLGEPFRLTGYGGGKPLGSYDGLRQYSEAYLLPVGAGEPLQEIDPKTAEPGPNEGENPVFCA